MALVDQYGRPLKGRRLPRGIDLFFQLPQVEALSLWDVRAAKEAATAHENGLFDVSARMYYAMLTDPRIADGLDKRNLALRNMDYDIVPGDGRSARTVCNKFRRAFGMTDEGATGINRVLRPQVAAELNSLAIMLGEAVAQPEWDYWADLDDGWYYPTVRPWHPQLLYFLSTYLPLTEEEKALVTAYPGQLYTYALGSARGQVATRKPVIAGDGQWLRYAPAGDQKPWLYGAMLSIWRPWVSRLMAMLLWLRYNDVHGMPIRLVKTPMGMRKTPEMQRFYKGVQNVGRDATLLAPHSSDGKFFVGVDLIEAKSESWRSLEASLNNHGKEITIRLTGGTQNTEATGGNYKGAEEQREIRHEVKAANAETWGACLNEQLLVPFAVLNGYEPDAAPRLKYDTRPPRNREADAKAAGEEFRAIQEACKAHELLQRRGILVPLDVFLQERGLRLPPGWTAGPVEPLTPQERATDRPPESGQ